VKKKPVKVDKKPFFDYYYSMMRLTTKVIPVLLILGFQLILPVFARGQTTFTQEDRKILIELKAALTQIDKRFNQVDKRFDQVDKRFAELREDMNKRFEQVDKRFEQFMSFVWILAAIFGAMTGVTIGFALWDRRTMKIRSLPI
jgi:predicted PurR-regulated permease PerM